MLPDFIEVLRQALLKGLNNKDDQVAKILKIDSDEIDAGLNADKVLKI
jgi:hypothetical protein